MSVETEINRIKANIANSYAKAAAKGADLPAVQDSNNLAATIETIPTRGLPDDIYTINVESSDPEGGTVSGGGMVSEGMTITVKAIENDGYIFEDWNENGEVVSNEDNYSFVVNKDRLLIATFVENPSRLPRGYKEVEYVQSVSGNPHFVIDIKPSATIRVEMDVMPKDSASSTPKMFFDSFYYDQKTYRYTFRMTWTSSGVSVANGRYETISMQVVNSSTVLRRMRLTLDIPNSRAYVDNSGAILTNNSIYNENMTYIWLLGYSGNSGYALLGNLYSCKIYSSGTLVRDLVPCINPEGKIGLYDLVTEEFYQSLGVFAAGPEV